MPTTTTNYDLEKPLVNNAVDEDLWGGQLNDNMDKIDTQMKVNADNTLLYETVTTVTSTSNAVTIDLSLGYAFSHTFTENTTFTFSNPLATGKNTGFKLFLTNDGTGRTPTWPAAVIWPDGDEPDLTTASQKNVLVFETIDGGTVWYGALAIGAAA